MNLDDEELFYTRLLNGKASIKEIEEYIKKLKRQINIKNEYLELIYDLGYDYDGCNTIKSLKKLIDELVDYAVKGYKNDDKSEIYMGGKNILCENVGEDNEYILTQKEDNEYILTQKEDNYIPKSLVREIINNKKEKNEYKIYTRGKQGGWSGPTIEHNKQKAIDIAKNSKQGNKDLEIIVIEHNKETNTDFPIDLEK